MVAWDLLSAVGLRRLRPELVSCPTCGRCQWDLMGVAAEVDAQSIRGKVVAGVARACARVGVPCVAITGSLDLGAPEPPGLAAVVPTAVDPDLGLAHALEHAEELYRLAVRRALGLVFLGASLRA